ILGFPSGCEGQFITDTLFIRNTSPIQAVVNDVVLCFPQQVTLTPTVTGGTPLKTYEWVNFAPPSSNPNLTVNPGATATYTLRVTDACDGIPPVETIVTVFIGSDPNNPLRFAELTSNTVACSNDPIILNAVPAGGTGNYQPGVWYPPAGVSYACLNQPCTSIELSGAFPAQFDVDVSVSDGCAEVTETVSISVLPAPNVAVVESVIETCPGAQVDLQSYVVSGSPPYTFVWQGPGGPFFGQSVVVLPGGPTVYTLTMTDGCDLTDVDSVRIVVPSAFEVTISGPQNVCRGGNVVLTAFAEGAVEYVWQPLAATGSLLSLSNVQSTLNLTVVARDAFGCTGEGQFTLNVLPNPQIFVSPPNPTICYGESVELTASGAGENGSYRWFPNVDL
ncbi:MAG: hypothetical protein NZ534_12375, partial [Bacteroidia bacterium]|nr:hypothetical protein [Bacteroidia bacterium]